MSQLGQAPGGMKPKQVLHAVLQRPGKLGAHSARGSLWWELLLGTEQCQPGEWEASNMKLFFRHFSCGYSQVLCSTVLLKLLQWALELSQSYFHSWIVVYCCSLWGEGDGARGILLRILVYHPTSLFPHYLVFIKLWAYPGAVAGKASLLPSLP